MKRVELFAYPAWHSLSPAMHNAAFEHMGIAARYGAREVPLEQLGDAVGELRSPEALGANVTIPHKQAVVPLLDDLSAEARRIGAVNTIVRHGQTLAGHNTDVSGFLRSLADIACDPDGLDVVMLGAGGAARAVAYALLLSGVRTLSVHNRTAARAADLAADLGRLGPLRAIEDRALVTEAPAADLLVNATSVGLRRAGVEVEETPLAAELLPRSGVVVDLIYGPRPTRLLREASAAGLATLDGLPMLVYQGAEAFSLWTGREAPTEVMRKAALKMLDG